MIAATSRRFYSASLLAKIDPSSPQGRQEPLSNFLLSHPKPCCRASVQSGRTLSLHLCMDGLAHAATYLIWTQCALATVVKALLGTKMGKSRLSRVARRFLVETLLEMHLEGFTLADMEVMLSLARLESGGRLVEPLEQEILLSWCAMVMLTLETVGLPRRPSAVRSSIQRWWSLGCLLGLV